MATAVQQHARTIALEKITVPGNVRDLDDAHVEALAGSIAWQGMLVPVVVRPTADGYELVAGFHRVAAARSIGLSEVPVVIRDEANEDADRAVENIASCRRRHDAINADRGVIPMSDLKRPTVRCEPGGEVGIRPGQIQAVRAAADDRLKWGLPLDSQKRARHRQPATRSRFVVGVAQTSGLSGSVKTLR